MPRIENFTTKNTGKKSEGNLQRYFEANRMNSMEDYKANALTVPGVYE